jgi:hypothetical protein
MNRRRVSVLLPCIAILACCAFTVAAAETWPELLREHRARYPRAAPQDLYALVYQGVMGSGTVIVDPAAMQRRLLRQIEEAQPDPSGPLIEPVDPEGRLVRIHLGAFKARGASPEQLAHAVALTSQRTQPDPQALDRVMTSLRNLDLGTQSATTEWRRFLDLMKTQGYPPLQHSDAYRSSYAPAYELLLAELLPGLGLAEDAGPASSSGQR